MTVPKFKKLKNFEYPYLGKTQSNSMRPTAMITTCKYNIKPQHDGNVLCSAGPSVKGKSQVYL